MSDPGGNVKKPHGMNREFTDSDTEFTVDWGYILDSIPSGYLSPPLDGPDADTDPDWDSSSTQAIFLSTEGKNNSSDSGDVMTDLWFTESYNRIWCLRD